MNETDRLRLDELFKRLDDLEDKVDHLEQPPILHNMIVESFAVFGVNRMTSMITDTACKAILADPAIVGWYMDCFKRITLDRTVSSRVIVPSLLTIPIIPHVALNREALFINGVKTGYISNMDTD